jgi:transcriptional regulator with XRE-family HTH domain
MNRYFGSTPLDSVLFYAASALKSVKNIAPGHLIRLLRKHLCMTQKELGQYLGLPQSYISNIEKGKVDLRMSIFKKIIETLHCTPLILAHAEQSFEVFRAQRAGEGIDE